MPKDFFEREPTVWEETLEELIFGFEYVHPEKANPHPEEPAQRKTAVELAIEERKRQAQAMRSCQEPSGENKNYTDSVNKLSSYQTPS